MEDGGRDMRKSQTVEGSMGGEEEEYGRAVKKEKKMLTVEGEGEGEVEEGGQDEGGLGKRRHHFPKQKCSYCFKQKWY